MPNFNLNFYNTWDELNSTQEEKQLPETITELINNGGLTNWQPLNIVENRDESGIYAIKDINNNGIYIGKASSFEDRRSAHWSGKERDSLKLHNAIRNERTINGDDGVANRFYWCRLLKLQKDNDILNKNEIYLITKYNTFRDSNHYNLTPGGDGGGHAKYIDLYNTIAKLLSIGKTEKEIRYFIKNTYNINIPENSTINDMLKNTEKYAEHIDDSLLQKDSAGKVYIRNRLYRQPDLLNLYYYDPNLSDEEILADTNFEKACGEADDIDPTIMKNKSARNAVWRAAVNNPKRARKKAKEYKWQGIKMN